MEWVFFVTKPSFMDFMSAGEKIGVFLRGGLFAAALTSVAALPFAALDYVLERFFGSRFAHTRLVPAVVVASLLGLMLTDNFTYTVFEVGVISSTAVTRALYIVLLGFFCYYFYRELRQFVDAKRNRKLRRAAFWIAVGLLALSLGAWALGSSADVESLEEVSAGGEIRKPNIVIFGSDGLDAAHLSLYGYERETTPNIEKLAQTALVAENHFSNASCSVGSVASTLTGKSPITNHFLNYPDILQGTSSYQHLIRILNREGYVTAQWGDSVLVNGDRWNMLDGFSWISGSGKREERPGALAQPLGANARYFVTEMEWRLAERLQHIFYIKEMEKPITSSADAEKMSQGVSDVQKLKEIAAFIRHGSTPFLIHVHLMNTHGPAFKVKRQVFSAADEENADWNPNFMDDAILQYDQFVERIIKELEEAGKLENTIFIVYTDHGSRWKTDARIPLVIRFPNSEHAGRVVANTQNLDIAPTILDYMNVPQPEWMAGTSLLTPIPAGRLIFSFTPNEEPSAPFYQFGGIRAVECNQWVLINLLDGSESLGKVAGHTVPCAAAEMRPAAEMRTAMRKLLETSGYDISGLPLP